LEKDYLKLEKIGIYFSPSPFCSAAHESASIFIDRERMLKRVWLVERGENQLEPNEGVEGRSERYWGGCVVCLFWRCGEIGNRQRKLGLEKHQFRERKM